MTTQTSPSKEDNALAEVERFIKAANKVFEVVETHGLVTREDEAYKTFAREFLDRTPVVKAFRKPVHLKEQVHLKMHCEFEAMKKARKEEQHGKA